MKESTLELRWKRLHPAAVEPLYSHPGDAGMDLISTEDVELEPGAHGSVGTGWSVQIPPGYEAQVRPRSGLALKHGITVLNSPGTIDSGYRGEIRVILINHGRQSFRIESGMRIAQLIIAPVIKAEISIVNRLAASTRDVGGFGSTGMTQERV